MDTVEDDDDAKLNDSLQTDNIEVLQVYDYYESWQWFEGQQDYFGRYLQREDPFQVVLIGDSGVGKTSFLIRFSEDAFLKNVNTSVGIDFWDTAGQESFRSLSKKYFQKADAVLIFFDITNSESFNNLEYWMRELNENCKDPNIPKILIGHKSDLTEFRVVHDEEIMDFVHSQQIEYMEASAKDNYNVLQTFASLGQKFIDMLEDGHLNFSKNNREMLIQKDRTQKSDKPPNCRCCLME